MKHYLIFDARCTVCGQLAEAVRGATGGKVEAINIYDDKARILLDQAYPEGWEHTPYLVLTERGRVRAWTGIGAAVRLTRLMGPRQTWRIWTIARRHRVLWPFKPPARAVTHGQPLKTRRQFLKTGIGISFAVVVAKLFNYSMFEPKEVYAWACDCTPPCYCTHVDTQTGCVCHCHNCDVCPARTDYEVRYICQCGSPCNGYWHCVTIYCDYDQICTEQCA